MDDTAKRTSAAQTRSAASMGPAPADARPHAPWPAGRKLIAYALLAALAAGAIWYIDLKAHRPTRNAYPGASPRYAAA